MANQNSRKVTPPSSAAVPEWDWFDFFREAGIPPVHSESYADVFDDNRITKEMIPDLSMEVLQAMGVAVMGDVIAVIKYAKELHAKEIKEKNQKAAMAQLVAKNSARMQRKQTESVAEDLDKRAISSRKRKMLAIRPPEDDSESEEVESGMRSQGKFQDSPQTESGSSLPYIGVFKTNNPMSDSNKDNAASASFYKDEYGNVKPVRKVPREREGNYIVKMPITKPTATLSSMSGKGGIQSRLGGGGIETKKKTNKIRHVEKKNSNTSSVFDRVGGGNGNGNGNGNGKKNGNGNGNRNGNGNPKPVTTKRIVVPKQSNQNNNSNSNRLHNNNNSNSRLNTNHKISKKKSSSVFDRLS